MGTGGVVNASRFFLRDDPSGDDHEDYHFGGSSFLTEQSSLDAWTAKPEQLEHLSPDGFSHTRISEGRKGDS